MKQVLSLLMPFVLFALCNPCTVFFLLKKRELDLFWTKMDPKKSENPMYSSVVCLSLRVFLPFCQRISVLPISEF